MHVRETGETRAAARVSRFARRTTARSLIYGQNYSQVGGEGSTSGPCYV